MKAFILTVAIFGSFYVLLFGFVRSMDKQDQVDCYKWQQQALEYGRYNPVVNPSGFYLTKSEKAQCDYWGIDVDVPVRTPQDINTIAIAE